MPDEPQSSLEVQVGDGAETVKLARYTSQTGQQFYGRPDTEDAVIFEYVVDHNEYRLPAEFTKTDVVLDIGAHIGSFAYAALIRGAGKVYAYEAHPINYAITCQNLAPFGDRVICRNRAVWRSDAPQQTLYNHDITGSANTGGLSVLWNDSGVPVETTSFDEVVSEASEGFANPVRLLKLDCEGSEYPILYTARQLKLIREICGEYHEIKLEEIPARAVVKGQPQAFNRHGLKDFLESAGWAVELEPKSPVNGLFHAHPQSAFGDGNAH